MYHYIDYVLLYAFSISVGLYITALLLPNKKYDMSEEIELEKEMIEYSKKYMFEQLYIDEINQLEDCSSSTIIDKNNVITLDIPFLNNKIIMYYDNDAFYYYTKGDVIYKYLNVACRKYVIEYKCKHLYADDTISTLVENTNTDSNADNNLFIKKVEKSLLYKKCNKFILRGSLDDYEKTLLTKTEEKPIDIIEFLSRGCS
jgi:hypothetical protein